MNELDMWRVLPGMVGLLAVLLSLPSVVKTWSEAKHIRRSSRRAESEFAFKLSEKGGSDSLSRYAQELGYAALVGDDHLSHKQRVVLLTMEDSERVIAKYSRLHNYVEVATESPFFRWRAKRHESAKYRLVVACLTFATYVIFSVAAIVVPFFYFDALLPNGIPRSFLLQFIAGMFFIAVGAFALVFGAKLNSAADLVVRTRLRGQALEGDPDLPASSAQADSD